MDALLLDIDARGVATLTLNRPDRHNAFNAALIAELTAKLRQLREDDKVRAVVLTGAGTSFSAGADLNWMEAMASASRDENRQDALRLAAMFRALDTLPKTVIARVNGHAFGGGIGLISCCDMAFALDSAKFGLTEVCLGLIPATIAPFVQARIGAAGMRRHALSGEPFTAGEAERIGLLNGLAESATALDELIERHVEALLKAAPGAVAECKQLIRKLAGGEWSADAADKHTAAWIARIRSSPEGRHGVQAFLQKKKPDWSR